MFFYDEDIRIFYYLNLVYFFIFCYYICFNESILIELESKYYLSHLFFIFLMFYNFYHTINIKDEFFRFQYLALFIETLNLLFISHNESFIKFKLFFVLAEYFYFNTYFYEDNSLDVW